MRIFSKISLRWFISCIILLSPFILHGTIRILCTAALIPHQYEMRKTEYINSLRKITQFGYPSYVVESCAQSPTFLDDYATHVFYTKTNNPTLHNKGVNEALSMLACFRFFQFNNDDIIIKLTGRYCFRSDTFLKRIEQNQSTDIFVKRFDDGQIFTGCFAMRYKYLKQMLEQIDYSRMEKNMINFEQEAAQYIARLKNISLLEINHFDLKVNFFGTGSSQLMEF